jgi:hypothetical protein
MTRVAGNNRSMSYEIEKIINKRIDDVKKDLENL